MRSDIITGILLPLLLTILLLLVLSMFPLKGVSQSPAIQLRGRVKDNMDRLVSSASITLRAIPGNSAIARSVVSDTGGRFVFDHLPPGSYKLSITHLGFQRYESEPIVIDLKSPVILQLPPIILTPGNKTTLQAVTVTAQKPLVEQQLDRTIIHLDALISNSGTNTLEVLGNTPGLEVDDEGIISLKGRTGVMVLQDGRPLQLAGTDLAAYLRSLPSGTLDRIEIMTNPPAKYSAAGTGGVINIITKKDRKKGFNANLTANIGTGVYGSSYNNLNFSYHHQKLSITGNISCSIANKYFLSDRTRDYFDTNKLPTGSLIQHYFEHSNSISSGGELALNYQFSRATTLDLSVNVMTNPYKEEGNYRSGYFNASDSLDSNMIVISHLTNNYLSTNLYANLRHSFDTMGREITLTLNEYTNRRTQQQNMVTSMYTPGGLETGNNDQVSDQPNSIHIYTANTGYTQPLKKGLKMEAGWQTEYSRTNPRSSYSLVYNDQPATDSSWSSPFLYTQWVHAAYGTISGNWKHISIQGGLRLENTQVKGSLYGNSAQGDTVFSRKYLNGFPTAYFSYKTDEQATHQWMLTLGRRINRPDYGSLDPTRFYFDQTTVYTGNPGLQPEFSNNAELTYVYKQNFTTTLTYSDGRDLIMTTFQQVGKVFEVIPENIGRIIYRGINVGFSNPFTSWWKGIFYAEYENNIYRQGSSGTIPVNSNGQYLRMSATQQFNPGKGWSAEINGTYKSKGTLIQNIQGAWWIANMAIRKRLFDDKCAVNLSWKDIFHTKILRRYFNTLPGQYVTMINEQDSRVVTLTVTYKFGYKGKAAEKSGDAKSEINRLKNSN